MRRQLEWLALALLVCAGNQLFPCTGRNVSGQQRSWSVVPHLPKVPPRQFSILEFGAVGDGRFSNTGAFQETIAACRRAGGGEVVVPSGRFLSGPIELESNMALVLDKGATILASQRFSDYENAPADGQNVFNQGRAKVLPLIRGANLTNITI